MCELSPTRRNGLAMSVVSRYGVEADGVGRLWTIEPYSGLSTVDKVTNTAIQLPELKHHR